MNDARVEPEDDGQEPVRMDLLGEQGRFVLEVEKGTGLSGAAIANLEGNPAFVKFLGEYDPSTGTTRRNVVEVGIETCNPDPLIHAVKGFQAAEAQKQPAQKPTEKPVLTAAKYAEQMNALSRENVYDPSVAAKIEALRAAARQGRVR